MPDFDSLYGSGSNMFTFITSFHGIRSAPEQIYHDCVGMDGGLDFIALMRAARNNGLKAKAILTNLKKLAGLPLPAIAEQKDSTFLIVAQVADDSLLAKHTGKLHEEQNLVKFESEWRGVADLHSWHGVPETWCLTLNSVFAGFFLLLQNIRSSYLRFC